MGQLKKMFTKPSRTKQSFKEECDINTILSKYNKTGVLTSLAAQNPKYGDFSNVLDYQDALGVVAQAHDQFAALSAKVRERFANDPARFLEFVSNEDNAEEAILLGLKNKPVETPAQAVPPAGSTPETVVGGQVTV